MLLVFEKLLIKNFMSIEEVELKFKTEGLTLVQGVVKDSLSFDSNGAGKSTLVESIVFVLYGQTLRGIKADEVVNRFYKQDCEICLEGTADSSKFKIVRYRKHKTGGNLVQFFLDDKDLTLTTNKLTDERIADFLKLSLKEFIMNVIMTGSTARFTDLGDTERKKIFDEIVNTEVYESCIDLAKQKSKEFSGMEDKCVIERDSFEKSIVMAKQSLTKALEDAEVWDHAHSINLQQKSDTLEKLELEFNNYEVDLYDQLSKFKLQLSDLLSVRDSQDISSVTSIKDSFKTCLKELELINSNKQSKSFELQTLNNEIISLEQKQKEVLDSIQSLNNSVNTNICSLCKQPLDSLAHIEQEIDRLESGKVVLLSKTESSFVKQKELDVELKELELKYEELSSLKIKLSSDIDKEELILKESLQKVNVDIDALQQSIKVLELKILEKDNCKDSIDSCKNELNRIKMEVNTHKGYVSKFNADILELSDKLELKNKEVDSLSQDSKEYFSWVSHFKKIKGLLISTITPIMNEKAEEYSRILTDGDMLIKFVTQIKKKNGDFKEVFDIEVERFDGGSGYKSLSSGERQRVDMIVMFVLEDLKLNNSNGNINVRFYDEVFDSLDGVGRERVMSLLESVSHKRHSFVITHRPELKDLFEDSIIVSKSNGFTTIVAEV